jgi:hypothetical protein
MDEEAQAAHYRDGYRCDRYDGHCPGQDPSEDEVVYTQVVTFRRAKIVMLEYFLDHQEALQAAGLLE